jgi:hypothetical protein
MENGRVHRTLGVEELEARIAPALFPVTPQTPFSFTDLDGDTIQGGVSNGAVSFGGQVGTFKQNGGRWPACSSSRT